MEPAGELSLAQVLAEGVAVWPDRGPRMLRMTGEDIQDFLQRMTTNDMRLLRTDTAVTTAFLSGTGRLLSVFTVIADEEGYWLSAPPGQAAALHTLLQGGIFFMDRVTVTDESAHWHCLQVHGAGAHRVLALLGLAEPDVHAGAVTRTGDLICVYHDALELPGYHLLIPVAQAPQVLHALQQAHSILMQDWNDYHYLRIRAGRGGFATEFTDTYNPLEVGLAWLCADNKGCYPGQEIIARQITYDKVTRHLVSLTADTCLSTGAAVMAGTARAGRVTSQTFDPDAGCYLGLAVIGRRYMDQDIVLQVAEQPVHWLQVAPAHA